MKTHSILTTLLLLAATCGDAQGADFALKRWAVIASPEVRELGVSDLLVADLTQRNFELVEREKLGTIAKELELTQLLGTKTKERLDLGLRLRADALILLSVLKYEDTRILKVVISECRQGARLRFELLPLPPEGGGTAKRLNSQPLTAALNKDSEPDAIKPLRPDELARRCSSMIDETRTHFAKGVQQLCAVSPFHSKNLTRDFDYLQVAYATLLGRALSQIPGTALVEVDEAHAIRNELAAVGEASIAERLSPTFIDGEFAMQGHEAQTRLRLKLQISDNKRDQRKLERSDLTQEQVVEWLLNDIPREAVATREGKSDRPRWTRREQFEKLAERADLFSATAAFEEATSLREAALLLVDNDVEQRFWLLSDLRRLQTEHMRESFEIKRALFLKNHGKKGSAAEMELIGADYQPRFDDARRRWERMGDLARWLLFQRALSRREAATVFVTLASDARYVMSFLAPDAQGEMQIAAERLPWLMIENMEKLDFDLRSSTGHSALLRAGFHVIGRVHGEADVNDKTCHRLWDYWQMKPDLGSTLDEIQRLKSWTRFVAEYAPRKTYCHHLATGMSNYRALKDANRVTKEQLLTSCDQIEKTDNELIQAYARCGRLAIRMAETSGKVDETMQKESQALRKIFRNRGGADYAFFFLNEVEDKARLKGFKTYALSTNTLVGVDPFPKIAFKPIANIRADWQKTRRVNETLDVMWSPSKVWTMSAGSAVRSIFEANSRSDDTILDVCFDDQCLWIFTKESGLRAYSHAGGLLGTTFPNDSPQRETTNNPAPPLPPVGVDESNRKVWPLSQFVTARYLHSLGPGRCLAIGTYVPKGRLWFTEVSLDAMSSPPRLNVKVIHECAKDPQESPLGDDDDSKVSFKPSWMTEIQTPGVPARRILLIGRPAFFVTSTAIRRPLAVDLEKLDITVFPARVGDRFSEGNEPRYFHSGKLISRAAGITAFAPPSDAAGVDWEGTRLLDVLDEMQQKKMTWLAPSKEFVSVGDHLECPDQVWWRIFPRGNKAVRIGPERISPRYRFEHYGFSAHFGMVAWNVGDELYRVEFDQASEPPRTLAQRYPFIPAAFRGKHDQAVQAIRDLGGHVDSAWSRAKLSEVKDRAWSTHAHLSDQWRGGDEGLKYLEDLYDLQALRLVRANVTDEGLKTLGGLTSLRRLNLEETRATDAGLLALTGLKSLAQVRLDPPADEPLFTDAGLGVIHHWPNLTDLTITGSGFTEAALDTIVGRPSSKDLIVRPFETKISAAQLKQLQTQTKRFRADFNLNLADQGLGW